MKEGWIRLMDRDVLRPGEHCSVQISFPIEDYARERLTVGAAFSILEGCRTVGEGTILEVSDV